MPDTWDRMIALAAKIKATGPDVAGIAYNIHDWPDDWLFRSMILQGGGQMLDASETASGVGGPVGHQGHALPAPHRRRRRACR